MVLGFTWLNEFCNMTLTGQQNKKAFNRISYQVWTQKKTLCKKDFAICLQFIEDIQFEETKKFTLKNHGKKYQMKYFTPDQLSSKRFGKRK